MKRNNCTNSKVDLSELLKGIRKSICSISQKINYTRAEPQITGMCEPFVPEYYYGLLKSLSSVLTYNYRNAKNKNEIHYLRQTHDLIEQVLAEFEYNRTNKNLAQPR
jgi:hypothetical protein